MIARNTHSTKQIAHTNRRLLDRLVTDFPTWTIIRSGHLWEAAREQDGIALTLTAPTPRHLRTMLTAVDEPDGDDTGAVPVVRTGGDA